MISIYFLYILFINIQLFSINKSDYVSLGIDEIKKEAENKLSWTPNLVINSNCRRFLYIDISRQGMGDMIERIVIGLSLAYKYRDIGITVVLDDDWGGESIHDPSGYKDILQGILFLPRFMNLSYVRTLNPKPNEKYLFNYGDYILEEYNSNNNNMPLLLNDLQCDTMLKIDNYDSCKNRWCSYVYSEDVEKILLPILRYQFNNNFINPYEISNNNNYNNLRSHRCSFHKTPLRLNVVNIVWHMRSGDICLQCEDPNYYNNIYKKIVESLYASNKKSPNSIIPHHNIVVHEKSFQGKVNMLFKSIPNVISYDVDRFKDIVCVFINTDILISTGSTASLVLSYFTPHLKPLLIQDERHQEQEVKYKYAVSPTEAIRISNGVINNSSNEIRNSLILHNVISRVESYL
jgi:hypothetical protein